MTESAFLDPSGPKLAISVQSEYDRLANCRKYPFTDKRDASIPLRGKRRLLYESRGDRRSARTRNSDRFVAVSRENRTQSKMGEDKDGGERCTRIKTRFKMC